MRRQEICSYKNCKSETVEIVFDGKNDKFICKSCEEKYLNDKIVKCSKCKSLYTKKYSEF